MRGIIFSKKSRDFTEKIPPKHRGQIGRRVEGLKTNIKPNDSKKLVGYDHYRIDSGEYRIIYRFDDAFVYIALIGKRNDDDVYKQLGRS